MNVAVSFLALLVSLGMVSPNNRTTTWGPEERSENFKVFLLDYGTGRPCAGKVFVGDPGLPKKYTDPILNGAMFGEIPPFDDFLRIGSFRKFEVGKDGVVDVSLKFRKTGELFIFAENDKTFGWCYKKAGRGKVEIRMHKKVFLRIKLDGGKNVFPRNLRVRLEIAQKGKPKNVAQVFLDRKGCFESFCWVLLFGKREISPKEEIRVVLDEPTGVTCSRDARMENDGGFKTDLSLPPCGALVAHAENGKGKGFPFYGFLYLMENEPGSGKKNKIYLSPFGESGVSFFPILGVGKTYWIIGYPIDYINNFVMGKKNRFWKRIAGPKHIGETVVTNILPVGRGVYLVGKLQRFNGKALVLKSFYWRPVPKEGGVDGRVKGWIAGNTDICGRIFLSAFHSMVVQPEGPKWKSRVEYFVEPWEFSRIEIKYTGHGTNELFGKVDFKGGVKRGINEMGTVLLKPRL